MTTNPSVASFGGRFGLADSSATSAELRVRETCSGCRALLLEDDRGFAARMIEALELAGFAEIVHVDRGNAALTAAKRQRFDVLILDRQNPGLEGLEVLRELRAVTPAPGNSAASPVLIVTDLGEPDDRIAALLSGSQFDDYVPKKYVTWEELLARVTAQIHRVAHQAAGPVSYGAFTADVEKRAFTFRHRHIQLSPREFDVMALLTKHHGRPVTRTMLWHRCWTDWEFVPDDHVNILNGALRRLRIRLAGQMPPPLQERDSVIFNVWSEGLALRLIEDEQ